jgi:hypothetical protein
MDFDAMAYPDIFMIGGAEHKGQRDRKKGEVLIPYTKPPTVQIGDRIVQRNGPNTVELQVLDVDYLEGGSLGVGTNHPHMLTLSVKNLTSAAHHPAPPAAIHIGSVSGHQVQVGNQNTQVVNITLEEVVKQVATAGDPEAKSLLRRLLENNTVAAIVGAGVAGLIGTIGA